MIRPLRSRHRTIIVGLALVVPTLLVAALAVRRPVPAMETLPAGLAAAALQVEPLRTVATSRPGLSFTAELARLPSGALGVRVEAAVADPRPDLLVYWTPVAGDRGMEGAYLLGTLQRAGAEFVRLPDEAQAQPGRLLLYSLGHAEVAAELELPAGGDR